MEESPGIFLIIKTAANRSWRAFRPDRHLKQLACGQIAHRHWGRGAEPTSLPGSKYENHISSRDWDEDEKGDKSTGLGRNSPQLAPMLAEQLAVSSLTLARSMLSQQTSSKSLLLVPLQVASTHAYLNVNPPIITRVTHAIFLLNNKGRKSVGGRLQSKNAPSTLPSHICIVKVQMSSFRI